MSIALTLPPWASLSPRAITGLLGIVVLLIIGAFATLAHTAWTRDSEQAAQEAVNLVTLMAQDVGRNIEFYDLSIQGARDGVLRPDVMNAPTPLRDAVLFDRAAMASDLGEITVLGPDGAILASSRGLFQPGASDADRDYFRIHALYPDFGLFVSRPLPSRSGTEQVIAFSRRITEADGGFGGVVVGTLRLDYIHRLFRKMKVGRNGSLSIFRSDGTLLMREPYEAAAIGLRNMNPAIFDLASRSPQGDYEDRSLIDGIRRSYHFQRIGALPLIVNVGLATGDIHSGWWRRAMLSGSLIGLCCGSIIMLTRRLGRELRRRTEAEAKLLTLVDTDGLTGLANRRCFDRVLASEWQRACYSGAPMSLLMVDADHFKAYNDLFGHAAGDELLRQVGRCLAAPDDRPGLLAARYGGEEFAVILPGFDGGAALALAEAIRRGIMELGIPHPGSSHGGFSVSIGCASTVPAASTTPTALLTAADVALYRSKRAGRNLVTWQDAVPEDLRLAS